MSAITINIPDSLYNKLEEFTNRDHVSVEDFAVSALAEKLSSFMTIDYLEERAKRANIHRFDELLAKIPPTTPAQEDRL
jgi:hypothetical protein